MSQRPASAAPSASQGSRFSRASHQSHQLSSHLIGAGAAAAASKSGTKATAFSLVRPATSRVTNDPTRTLHDPESFWDNKMQKSAKYFHGTRVQTCSHIIKKNGKAIAVQFPLEKTGWKAPTSYQNTKKSSEVQSWSQNTYKQLSYHHSGMPKKPLSVYKPNAKRSMLPQPTIVMPYKNSSQVVIGDRSSYDRRQYLTTNVLQQKVPDLEEACTNGGIISERVKWTHKHAVMP